VKFSYENYRGAKADVSRRRPTASRIVDDRTIRFVFKEPFLDLRDPVRHAQRRGPAGWCPRSTTKQVGPDGFKQKPIGAGPFKLVRHEPGVKVEMEAFDGLHRPVNAKQLVMISVPRRPPGSLSGARRGRHHL